MEPEKEQNDKVSEMDVSNDEVVKEDVATTIERQQSEIDGLKDALTKSKSDSFRNRNKAKDLEDQKSLSETKSLEEQKQFKELYENSKNENKELKERTAKQAIKSEINMVATRLGIIPEAVDLLHNLDPESSNIMYDFETTNVYGVDEAVEKFKKEKPFLFGSNAKDLSPKNKKSNFDNENDSINTPNSEMKDWNPERITAHFKKRQEKGIKSAYAEVSKKKTLN